MQTSQSLLIKNIITDAIKRGAVDLHLSVGNNPVLRLNGELVYLDNYKVITQEFMDTWTESLLNEQQKKCLYEDREVVLTHNFDKQLRFKINLYYQRGYLSSTLRYIPAIVPTIDSLGLNPILKDLSRTEKGLVIISGAFGSGRSTTIAAMIEEINQQQKKYIITIEDPIEYLFINKKSIIEQREIGRDVNSYSEAVKYFQEEDGDVLCLEEIDGPMVIPEVLEIAGGGALVLTTVSATSASNTVSRILNSFTSLDLSRVRDLLANSLFAVVCQKIVPKIGGGVEVIGEVMIVNDAIRSIIMSGNIAQIDNIIQTSRKEGMISFDNQLAKLVQARKIAISDAMDNTANKKLFENLIK
ncbi:MAG TPA: ATPase, T2SS/T4P/T4SS family [Patescibacteria group bacterium]|nr:ATPase, T2SS/T4P/T4SS family [Patescibacteria group bacterium]